MLCSALWTQISTAVKLTCHREKNGLGEKKSTGQKRRGEKNGSTSFSSAPNTHETYGAHSHAAIARLGCVIVNTVTCCYSQGLAIGLNRVILTHLCAMFQLSKSKCYESFETKFSRKGFGGLDFSFSFESVPLPGSAIEHGLK